MMLMKRLLYLLIATMGGALADHWPQWMGEERDGIWRESGVRKDLPEGTAKVLWRSPVALGYAGPTVAKGKVYMPDFVMADGDFDGNSQSAHPRKGVERILCLDAETGMPLWKHEYEVTYNVPYPGGPRVSPTVIEGYLYFQGTMGHLWCLDAESGDVMWNHDICKDYQCEPHAGATLLIL